MVSECTQLFCMFLLPRGEFQIPNMKPIYMNDLWMFLEVLGGSRKKENLKMNLSEKTNLFGNGNKTLLLDVSGLGFLLTNWSLRLSIQKFDRGNFLNFLNWPAFDMSLWDVFEPWYGQLRGDESLIKKVGFGRLSDWYCWWKKPGEALLSIKNPMKNWYPPGN